MKNPRIKYSLPLMILAVLMSVTGCRLHFLPTATQLATNTPVFVIDPGHGGLDGGAVSCTGVLESHLNLRIALRLNDLLHLMGQQTVMTRTTDISLHTQGNTIAAKKASDLKQRVQCANKTENGVLVSLHQNQFSDSRYSGAQVFYGNVDGSQQLAETMQALFLRYLNPGSRRKAKPAESVYLMRHINHPGILIECGFLSNVQEEMLLRSEQYQKKLCAVIASALMTWHQGKDAA